MTKPLPGSSAPILLYSPTDSSSQKVLLLSSFLNISLKKEIVNVDGMEHYSDAFRAKSMQSTIPVLKASNEIVLCETPAILAYLASTYGDENKTLYPQDDILKQARINQVLEYDYSILKNILNDMFHSDLKYFEQPDDKRYRELKDAICWINNQVKKRKFMATDHFSLADLVLAVTISQIKAFQYNTTPYTLLNEWYERCKVILFNSNFKEIVEDYAKEVAQHCIHRSPIESKLRNSE